MNATDSHSPEASFRRTKAYREIVDEFIASHNGRMFGSAGDGVIAEFASPVETVHSAKEIHMAIEKRNTALLEPGACASESVSTLAM